MCGINGWLEIVTEVTLGHFSGRLSKNEGKTVIKDKIIIDGNAEMNGPRNILNTGTHNVTMLTMGAFAVGMAVGGFTL